jgi:hypothetical protein
MIAALIVAQALGYVAVVLGLLALWDGLTR